MTEFNTGNAIPSSDVRDLLDNATVEDNLVNGLLSAYPDRLGVSRKSWAGMEADFLAFLAASGFETAVLAYTDGAPLQVDRPTQLIERVSAPGTLYSIKLPSSFPVVLSGTWATDEALLVVRIDQELRQDLADPTNPALGAGIVGRALRHINSVAELATVDGRYDGDVVYLTTYYSGASPYRGGGALVWDATSTATADNGLIFQALAAAGRWIRPDDHVLSADDYGIIHETVPTTDQTARVQAFLDGCEGRQLCVARAMTVGINGPVQPKSNTNIISTGLNLFALSTFVGTPVIGFMVEFIGCVNTKIMGMQVNGNAIVIAGGLLPVVAGDFPRGFGVLESCDRVELIGCYAFNVWGNGFICFNGGAGTPLSTNVTFKNCESEACGLGFGQEIRNVDTAGPGPVTYDQCFANLCNYGLYIAGGNAHIIGGTYHSKRLQALVIYTGDSHAETRVTGTNPKFRITPETGSNQVALIHCIDKAASSPNFDLQQFLVVDLDAPEFICDHTGTSVQIETGSNVTLNKPVFKGGGAQLRGVVTASTGGPYKEGSVVVNSPEFLGWANSADSVLPAIPMTLNNPRWTEPVGPNSGCVRLALAGQRVVVNSPQFGATGSAVQPQNGISASVDGTIVVCNYAVNFGLTGSLFNVGTANSELWTIENSSPVHALDRKKWSASTAAPTVGTWSRGDIVWQSLPSAGGFAGFVCTTAGTPGTWKTFGAISA